MNFFKKSSGVNLSDAKEQMQAQSQNIHDPKAQLASDRNRWFAVSLALAMACLVLSVLSIAAIKKDRVVGIYWVKMFPNGRWEVQTPKADSDVEFYPRTIDHFLERWVVSRYSELKNEVAEQYGFAATYMNSELNRAFKDPDGFNAVKIATDIRSCETCPQVHIKVRDINHSESINAKFGRVKGLLYRSDVYIMKTVMNFDGSVKEKTYHIVPIKWRLKSKEEIKADLLNEGGEERLRANPVGIEIREYSILNDHVE